MAERAIKERETGAPVSLFCLAAEDLILYLTESGNLRNHADSVINSQDTVQRLSPLPRRGRAREGDFDRSKPQTSPLPTSPLWGEEDNRLI
jgi:hypothetical protein